MIETLLGRRASYANPSSADTDDRAVRRAFGAVTRLGEPLSVTLVSGFRVVSCVRCSRTENDLIQRYSRARPWFQPQSCVYKMPRVVQLSADESRTSTDSL